MAVIRPFKALRPAKEVSELVASVPYDVVNTQEARELAGKNNLSFLRITRSEIELPDDANPYDSIVYTKAKENLDSIVKAAPLVTEATPSFYLYELEMDGRKQTGIGATFSVDDYDNDIILKHEKTRKVKEDDRTNHIITTSTQTGVVFLTYKPVAKIDEIVEKVKTILQPVYDFIAEDGISHRVWIVPQEYNEAIIEEIGKSKNLYIADGHHRAASASRARAAKKESNPNHTGNEEYNYFIAVLFPADQLYIMPYNRVVVDLNGNTEAELLEKIGKICDITENGVKMPLAPKSVSMYLNKKWFTLKIKDSYLENGKLKGAKTIGESLDVSILQDLILNPILDVDDPRTSKRVDFVGGIRGTAELEKLVDSGKFGVAFSMSPVTLDDLMNISDAGEIMPPKSTWFEPKLRDGLMVHGI